MTGRTHLATGIAGGLALAYLAGGMPHQQLLIVAMTMVGSLLPDVDHPQSILSGYIPGSGIILNGIMGIRHRGFTHSLLFVGLFVTIPHIMANFAPIPDQLIAICAGMLIHFAGDMLTPQGVPLLYPLKANWKLAPGVLLSIGHGLIESLVFVTAAGGIVYLLVLHVQRYL